jgi:hypothetical protein
MVSSEQFEFGHRGKDIESRFTLPYTVQLLLSVNLIVLNLVISIQGYLKVFILTQKNMKYLSIGIAFLLLGCLANMPYGYFQFVRFVSAAFFSYAFFHENEKGSKELAVVFLVLAILFQPFIKISLGRSIWNVVDVIVSVGLFGYSFYKKK